MLVKTTGTRKRDFSFLPLQKLWGTSHLPSLWGWSEMTDWIYAASASNLKDQQMGGTLIGD